MTQKEQFTGEVERRFRALFSASRAGYRQPDTERHRLAGFINAGVFLGLTSNAEMQELMESVHLEVFGETMTKRRQTRPGFWLDEGRDYAQYESPAFERRPGRGA